MAIFRAFFQSKKLISYSYHTWQLYYVMTEVLERLLVTKTIKVFQGLARRFDALSSIYFTFQPTDQMVSVRLYTALFGCVYSTPSSQLSLIP